jgi:acyl-CoA thioesterase II
MGDLAADTHVDGRDGRYSMTMSRAWEIWGPNGGYVASVALRAAGAHSRFERPASIVGHFLGVASFDAPVEIETTTLREAKRAESVRVSIGQEGSPIFDAMVWAVGDVDGLEHDFAPKPDVPDVDGLMTVQERLAANGVTDTQPPFPFWLNFEERPVEWVDNWEEREPSDPNFLAWFRYEPVPTCDDLWVDACRSLILVDTLGWPSVQRWHTAHTMIAPSIDLAVAFHRFRPDEPWLLAQATSRSAHGGIIGCEANVWSRDGALLATGISQLLCRPVRT